MINSLVRKSFRILLGRGIVSFFTLLFTIYFAYELPKSIFALIALYDVVISLSKVISDVGLHYFVLREAPPLYYSDKKNQAIGKIILPSIIIRLVASIFVCLLYWLLIFSYGGYLYTEFPDLNINYIAFITVFHLLIENIQSILIPVFAVQQRFGTNSFLESSTILIENFLALSLYIMFGMNQYFLGLLIGQFIILVIRLFYIKEIFRVKRDFLASWKDMLTIIRDYLPFYIRKFFRIGFIQGEQMIIAALLPLAQLANYNLAKKCSSFLKDYQSAFIDPLTIKLAKTGNLGFRQQYIKTYLWFTLPLPLVLAVASPWIMPIVGGSKYADSWLILCILYLSYIFLALSSLQLTILTIFGKKTDALMRDATGGTIGLAVTLLLVYTFKEYGIAWGQMVSYMILAFLGYKLSRKYLHQDVDAK